MMTIKDAVTQDLKKIREMLDTHGGKADAIRLERKDVGADIIRIQSEIKERLLRGEVEDLDALEQDLEAAKTRHERLERHEATLGGEDEFTVAEVDWEIQGLARGVQDAALDYVRGIPDQLDQLDSEILEARKAYLAKVRELVDIHIEAQEVARLAGIAAELLPQDDRREAYLPPSPPAGRYAIQQDEIDGAGLGGLGTRRAMFRDWLNKVITGETRKTRKSWRFN